MFEWYPIDGRNRSTPWHNINIFNSPDHPNDPNKSSSWHRTNSKSMNRWNLNIYRIALQTNKNCLALRFHYVIKSHLWMWEM